MDRWVEMDGWTWVCGIGVWDDKWDGKGRFVYGVCMVYYKGGGGGWLLRGSRRG